MILAFRYSRRVALSRAIILHARASVSRLLFKCQIVASRKLRNVYVIRGIPQPGKLKNARKIDDSSRTRASVRGPIPKHARTRGSDDPGIQLPRVPSTSQDSKRNLKSYLAPASRSHGTLDLTRNWLSIILPLLRGRDTY